MADFEPKEWTNGATDENVIHAADCERWQAGIAEAGGRWDGEWEDDDKTGLGNITADQLSALETEIHKLVSTFEIKAVSDGSIPGVDEWNRIEEGIVRAISSHAWNITWQWSDDYTTCTAVFEDADTGDTETVECVITSVVTAPTCTEQGYTTFTATATLDGVDYTDIVIGDYVPATGHKWGEPEWDWAEDCTSCQAVFTCEICGDKDTVDCTVTETAEGGYTATCTHDGTEYSDTVGPWIAFAVYTIENSLIFGAGSQVPPVGSTYLGEAVVEAFTGFETETWEAAEDCPWYDYLYGISAITIDASFKHVHPVSTANWFVGAYNDDGVKWSGLDNIDASSVTDMSYMFSGAQLTDTSGLANWDTSSVTNMSDMFAGSEVTDVSALADWDVSSVTTMSNMFSDCQQLTTIDVSKWDTSSVTNMSYMFGGCSGLTTIYSDDSKFVTTAVISGGNMFISCSKLVGGNGTAYDSSNVSYTMAHVDTADNPGYFTQR